MRLTKKILSFGIGAVLSSFCVTNAEAAKVGISMPNDHLQLRWFSSDSVYLKDELEKLGHEVVITYAGDNDILTQTRQVENLVDTCDFLVIVPIDSKSLNYSLDKAYKKKIPVISYDRMLRDTKSVSYYVGTDSKQIGSTMAKYVVDKLRLMDRNQPANIEIFAGDINDENTIEIDYGVNSVLRPFFEIGKLNILSHESALKQNQTVKWSKQYARERMQRLAKEQGYAPKGKKLDAVIAFNDATARGVIDSLRKLGYKEGYYPVITGQDCNRLSVSLIENDVQSMSIFKDERKMAIETARIIDTLSKKKMVTVNHPEGINNGFKNVPSQLIDVVVVTKDNVKPVLYDSGYITEENAE